MKKDWNCFLFLLALPGAIASADLPMDAPPASADRSIKAPDAAIAISEKEQGKKAPDSQKAESKTQINARVSVLEAQMSEVCMHSVHGNYGARTASASPPILGENWFFNGEMLWWHVDEGGTDYAQLFYGHPGATPTDPAYNRRLKFKWDFGFRAGIGTTFNHDKWDLFLNFTWFRTKNSAATSLHGGMFIAPLIPAPLLNASQAKVHWNIHFYTLDLDLGRNYFISPRVAFHPYVGLKTAWISQHVRTSSQVFFPIAESLKTKDRNGFWGIGPQLGVEGKWFLDYGFNLFASGGGSILWGDFDITHKEVSPALLTRREKINLDVHDVAPMAQFQIGIGYETNVYHNTYRIEISARYENQYWWSQNQMPYFAAFLPERFQRYSEDLSLQGLTVDARFDF